MGQKRMSIMGICIIPNNKYKNNSKLQSNKDFCTFIMTESVQSVCLIKHPCLACFNLVFFTPPYFFIKHVVPLLSRHLTDCLTENASPVFHRLHWGGTTLSVSLIPPSSLFFSLVFTTQPDFPPSVFQPLSPSHQLFSLTER